jgi:large subunit ribosomal protein L24
MKIANQTMKRSKPSPQMREAEKKTKWDIVRGDKVQVIGKHPERGKQGIIKEVLRTKDRVIVEGVNLGPKIVRPNPALGLKGRTIMKERTIHYSKVNLVCPATGKPTRISKMYQEDGTKVRVSKKSGAIIPKPEFLTMRRKPISSFVSDGDSVDEDVWEQTYQQPKSDA